MKMNKIDKITMDKQNMIWINGVPVKSLKNQEVGSVLKNQGHSAVELTYQTYPGSEKKDMLKFLRRAEKFANEGGYYLGNFTNKIIDGYLFEHQYTMLLIRIAT